MGMLQLGGEADLPREALDADGGAQLRVEHLDGHLAIVLHFFGEKHGGHAAVTELALDHIAAVEAGPQALQGIGHWWCQKIGLTLRSEGYKYTETWTRRPAEPDGPSARLRTRYRELLPAEDLERHGETDHQPCQDDRQLGPDLRQPGTLQHVGPESIVHGGERQCLDEWLQRVGEVGGGEEHAGKDPHREHGEVHDSRSPLNGLWPGTDQQPQAAEAERPRQADQRERPQ